MNEFEIFGQLEGACIEVFICDELEILYGLNLRDLSKELYKKIIDLIMILGGTIILFII